MYDVAIIGAGPSGLMCALVLTKLTDLKIVIIDGGEYYENKDCSFINGFNCSKCHSCSNITGFGGSAYFNPGKLSLFPAGSGLQTILGSEECCKKLYSDVIDIMMEFGLNIPIRYETNKIPSLPKNDRIIIKYYNSYPITRQKMNSYICRVQDFLNHHTDLLMNHRVMSIQRNMQWELLLDDGERITTKRIAIGTGESGYRWWNRIADMLDVKRIRSNLDIGIRIEFPAEQLERYWPYHKDLKIMTSAPDGSELRTYCVLKNGITVPCYYGDFTVLDGIFDEKSNYAGMTIFNRIDDRIMGVDKINYVDQYLKRFYTKNHSPQFCSAFQFMNTDKWKEYSFAKQIYENIKYGFQSICDYLGIDQSLVTKVYVPVVDNLWDKCIVSDCFETSTRGIYIMGDATGIARGIMQAAVSGVAVAYGIKRSVENEY